MKHLQASKTGATKGALGALGDVWIIFRLAFRNLAMIVAFLLVVLTIAALMAVINPGQAHVITVLGLLWRNSEFLVSMAFIASTFPLVWQFNAVKRGWDA